MKLPHLPRLMLTRADFPDQDWTRWEAARFGHPGLGQTVDTNYLDPRPCCIQCSTWICSGCWNFRRNRATRTVSQYCPRCGSSEGFFSATRHVHQHEALPQVPFQVPVIGRPALEVIKGVGETAGEVVRRLEAHDGPLIKGISARELLAYYKKVAIEQPNREKLMAITPPADEWPESTADEREFWGIHPFKGAIDSLGCQLCGWGYNDQIHKKETKVHVPEEANIADEVLTADEAVNLTEDEARERGFLPPKLTANDLQDEVLPHAVTLVTDKIREAYANGNNPDTILAFKIRLLQELCDLAVQPKELYPYEDGDMTVIGPSVFADADEGVISWKGDNYYLRQKTDKVKEDGMIAERHQQMLRREAMQWAVQVCTGTEVTSPPSARASSLTQTADRIFEWMIKKS